MQAMAAPTTSLLPAALALVGGGLLGLLLAQLVQRALGRLTRSTASTTDDFVVTVLVDTIPPVAWVVSASLAWQILPTTGASDRVVFGLAKLILVVLIVRLVNRIGLRLLQRWANRAGDLQVANLIRSLAPMLKALVWCLGAVFYLQNIGVQMAAIWALLSAGGIGAGLALKEPVSQFFEYITILLDKPFQPGQLIHVGQVWGTVEKVGVRSTRLRSINGEAIVMSNSSLTGAVVANFGEMQRRRLSLRLGLKLDTPIEQLERLPNLLAEIVQGDGTAEFERCHFVSLSTSSLEFELVYGVPTNDFKQALDVQQRINLQILRRFAEQGLELAATS
jgi:small-conductance mechanosensitive channel